MLNVNEIKDQLPHRFPFLLVDRIVEVEKGQRAVGIKNVTVNDYYGQQDFSCIQTPYPGSLQVEAMAQVAAFAVKDLMHEKVQLPLLASIEKARFRQRIKPGDQLRIEVNLKKFKANTCKFLAFTYIENELASEVEFTCVFR